MSETRSTAGFPSISGTVMRAAVATALLLAGASCDGDHPPATSHDDGRFRNPFGEVCDRPCLFGATLGETPRSEAEQLVGSRPFVAGRTTRSTVAGESRFYGQLASVTLREDDRGLLDNVTIAVGDDSVTYGEVLNTMGAPRAVRFALHSGVDGGYVSWFYDRIVLTSWLDEPRIAPEHRVTSIEIDVEPIAWPYHPVALNAIPFTHYEVPGWLGFGTVDEYLDHPSCRTAPGTPGPHGGPCGDATD